MGFNTLQGAARSSLGLQSESQKPGLPQYTFPHSSREQDGRVFLSQKHVEVENRGKGPATFYRTPGAMDKQPLSLKSTAPQYSFGNLPQQTERERAPPVGTYTLPPGIGKQPESRCHSPPRVTFGRSRREDATKTFTSAKFTTNLLGTQGPDPGHYPLPGSIGLQPSSMKRSNPSFSLPRTDRLRDEYERMTRSLPAPGKYDTWSSIGKQALSASRTQPAFGFGSSTWGREEKRFLSLAHTRELRGVASPAHFNHQTAAMQSGFGQQVLSSRESPSRPTFGTAPQRVFKVNDTPGPGTY